MKSLAAQLNCSSGSLCKRGGCYVCPVKWICPSIVLVSSSVAFGMNSLHVSLFSFDLLVSDPWRMWTFSNCNSYSWDTVQTGAIVKYCESWNMPRFCPKCVSVYVCSAEKLISLLPEYVVPYAIHLLVHDPDYVKVQDIEQLKDIKEWVHTNYFSFSSIF